jgi:tagatose-1,6-bisphosphate aldolase
MPDGAYRPQISPKNKYIAFQNNALNGKVYIFSFNNAKLNKFNKPIYAVGIGEQIEDLQEFDAEEFTKNLVS